MKSLLPPLFLLLSHLLALCAVDPGDPFAPWLDAKVPEILREIPRSGPVPAGVTVRQIVFRSRDHSEIFAVIAAPGAPGKHPGILVLHGGGGSAEADKAVAWAQRGYLAVAPDMPGIGAPEKLIHTKGRWDGMKYGEGRWVATPDAGASVIFDAVLSAYQALCLLRSLPDVDPGRIGVVGVSWGGYMTTMICGLAGDRVKAGFALYGCGFFDLGGYGREKGETYNPKLPQTSLGRMPLEERERWFKYLDAGRRAPGMKAAYFLAAATNDFFGYLLPAQATLDAIPGEKNHVFAPNANHKLPIPGGSLSDINPPAKFTPSAFQPVPTPAGQRANWVAMEVPYFDYHLRGIGEPFPEVSVKKGGSPFLARFKIAAPHPITNVQVYWARANPDARARVWCGLPATLSGNDFYEAALPAEAADWFVMASDDRPVTVSSDLIHISGHDIPKP